MKSDGRPDSAPVTDVDDVVRMLRAELSRVYHDASNPLSIVLGNAELLCEMGGALGWGEEVIGPLQDIEAACGRVEEALDRLVRLRDQMPH